VSHRLHLFARQRAICSLPFSLYSRSRAIPSKSPRLVDEKMGEVGVDAPVVDFVGVSQRVARHLASDAHVIEFRPQCPKAGFDVAQALAIGQLGEGHDKELIEAGEAVDFAIALIALDAGSKAVHGQEVHDLREHDSA